MVDFDDEKFERLWLENKHALLNQDAEYRELTDNYKMTSATDWLLFGTPVLVGIASIDLLPIEHELLRWLACAGITIAAFGLSVLVKSQTSGGKSISAIEKRIKEDFYNRCKKEGRI